MKQIVYLPFFVLLALLSSCSSEESSVLHSSVPFYQDLSITYDMTHNKTHAGANFNKNKSTGENIKLTADASIRFNNEIPNYANILPYFYTYTFNGTDKVTFTFTRSKGNVYVNSGSLEDVNEAEILNTYTTFYLNRKNDFFWFGKALEANEQIQVSLEQNGGISYWYNYEAGSISVEIDLTENTILQPGEATFTVTRTATLPLKENNGTAGGQMQVSYQRSKTVTIQ